MAAARAVASGGVLKLKPVTFVTGNAKKLEEVKVILGQSIPFQSLKLDLPELQGDPEDISKEKARLAADQSVSKKAEKFQNKPQKVSL
ncbi:inosine triphosphate pyrophosphatase [Tanacetum coccineum]